MPKLFISHSSKDDGLVRELRAMLADHGEDGWIDSRGRRGTSPLWTELRSAIEEASGYAVVVSPEALRSKWLARELCYALKIRDQGGKARFPVIPLSVDGTRLGVLEEFFGDEPVYVPVSSEAGGVETAVNAILVAMGKRGAGDVAATPQPRAEPVEDLVLELTDPRFHERDGKRRVSARAQLVYQPATPGQPELFSSQPWRLVVPLRPVEAGTPVAMNLVKWGRALHQVAMPAYTSNVMRAWARLDGQARRRFSVEVDATLVAAASDAAVLLAQEAGADLLAVPWELLHDGQDYLFQGARLTRVRRRVPNTRVLDVPVVAPPVRVLFVSARPEDDDCSPVDHRASAQSLVEALEPLTGLVQLHVLAPPTFPAFSAELDRARREKRPYHVVHFHGPGVHDYGGGLGGLCFERPENADRLEGRRHVTVFTDQLGPWLHDHRIPLVMLDVCRPEKGAQASASVASGLLKLGVASLIALDHGLPATSTHRFLAAFYRALAAGARVGDAMLAGQREHDPFPRQVSGEQHGLPEDWVPPQLFQQKDDPQLFRAAPAEQARED